MPTIKDVRIEQGLTQQELASKANIAYATVSRLERGKHVTKGTLTLICQVLGISPDEVTGVNTTRVRKA